MTILELREPEHLEKTIQRAATPKPSSQMGEANTPKMRLTPSARIVVEGRWLLKSQGLAQTKARTAMDEVPLSQGVQDTQGRRKIR